MHKLADLIPFVSFFGDCPPPSSADIICACTLNVTCATLLIGEWENVSLSCGTGADERGGHGKKNKPFKSSLVRRRARWITWLPDGDCQILRSYVFGPLGLKDYGSATLLCKV